MAKKTFFVAFVALASLHIIQGLGLYDTPFPAALDRVSDYPLNTLVSLSYSWNISTLWMGALRRSYAQILRYESEDTLQRRLVYFTNSVDTGASKYKVEIEQILEEITGNSIASKCAEEHLDPIKQMVSRSEEQLKECTVQLKELSNLYEKKFKELNTVIIGQNEETIYAPCTEKWKGGTLTKYNGAVKCFNKNLQLALDNVYYEVGSRVLKEVTEMRVAVKNARDVAYECSKIELSPATEEAITEGIAMTRRECRLATLNRQKRAIKNINMY